MICSSHFSFHNHNLYNVVIWRIFPVYSYSIILSVSLFVPKSDLCLVLFAGRCLFKHELAVCIRHREHCEQAFFSFFCFEESDY